MFFEFVIAIIGICLSRAEVDCAAVEYSMESDQTTYFAVPLNACFVNEFNGAVTGLVWHCNENKEPERLQFANKECSGAPLITYAFADSAGTASSPATLLNVYCDKAACKYVQQTSITTTNEDCDNPTTITRTGAGGISSYVSGYCFGAGSKWSCDGDKVITASYNSYTNCANDPYSTITFTSLNAISCGVDGNSTEPGPRPYIMNCGTADWVLTNAAHSMYHIYVFAYVLFIFSFS